MNAIQIKETIGDYTGREQSSRFSFAKINNAVNNAIKNYIDERKKVESAIREDLYTLLKEVNPTVTTLSATTTLTTNHINYPSDYYWLSAIDSFVDGVLVYAFPTNNNEVNNLLLDSICAPDNSQTFYLEDATGYKIYRGVGGTLTVAFQYIKNHAVFSIGNEANLINSGASVLTILSNYTAVEESVHNSITYNPGDAFVAVTAILTSGQVILSSVLTTCDLPDKAHEEISKEAAAILTGQIGDYGQSKFAENELNKNLS